jgi:ribose transport system substrate-binding protein
MALNNLELSRRGILLGVGGSVALLAAGCATSSSTSPKSNGAGKQITVGYAGYTLANPFFAGVELGMKRATTKHGFKLLTTNANGDPALQFTNVQNMLNQGIDYLVFVPIDAKANRPAVQAAVKRGVPVLCLFDQIPNAGVTSTLTPSHYTAGKLAAEYSVRQLQKRYGKPAGNVAEMIGAAGIPAAALRSNGFRDVIKKYPDIKIVASQDGGFDTEKSNTAAVGMLQAHAKIDLFYGANDAEALGIMAAIKRANRFVPVGAPNHIIVVGIDGAKQAIAAIRAGELDATISQQPLTISAAAVKEIADLIAKKKVPETVWWPLQEISMENINSAQVKAYGIWGDDPAL